jgi:arginase
MDRPVRIIGVPTDYGADRRGVDMGPSAIRYAGLADKLAAIGVETSDRGDLAVPRRADPTPRTDLVSGPAKYLDEIEIVTTRLSGTVRRAIEDGSLPLVLGGDHSIALGTLTGVARDREIGVVWFDAHGDFNVPETTPSGNVHGMSLAAALGHGPFGAMPWTSTPGVSEENVALVGLRDLDPGERERIRESDVSPYAMSDIDDRGLRAVVEEALDVATDGVDAIHVSFDLDFLDPKDAPGVGTPVRGGVTYREAHSALEAVADRNERRGVLASLEFVEVNPILDERNETARLATELAASALGKRVL